MQSIVSHVYHVSIFDVKNERHVISIEKNVTECSRRG